MLVNIDPGDSRPLYRQIVDEVRRALVAGELRPDDPLPSVRDLAAQLVINPRTVRQAYGELEQEGVIYVKRGLGTFVAPGVHLGMEERRAVARRVAKRALLEARRSGFGAMELMRTIAELAEEEEEASVSAGTGNVREDE